MREGQRGGDIVDLSALFGGSHGVVSATLPPGEILTDQSTVGAGGQSEPSSLCWISESPPTPQLIARLRADHRRSGLCPLLVCDDTEVYGERCTVGVVPPEPLEHIERWNAQDVIQRIWDGLCRTDDELGPAYEPDLLAPYGETCPTLARPGGLLADPDILANQQAPRFVDDDTKLAVVPVRRGADALTALGWSGAANHVSRTAGLSAMVRSWEERFGARVLRLGPDWLDLSVSAPPHNLEHATIVAAEHWAFSPDRVLQDSGSITRHAAEIRGRRTWSFWWD